MVVLYEQMVGQMEEVQRQARLRFKAGESPSTDVAQAAARLAEAQAAPATQRPAIIHFKFIFMGSIPLD